MLWLFCLLPPLSQLKVTARKQDGETEGRLFNWFYVGRAVVKMIKMLLGDKNYSGIYR